MSIPIALAPPLIVGLGLRVVLKSLFSPASPAADPSLLDPVLTGAWQGMLFWHAVLQYPPEIPLLVGAGIAIKLLYDIFGPAADGVVTDDPTNSQMVVASVLGMALGVIAVDLLSRLTEEARVTRASSSSTPRPRRERTVQFRSTRRRSSRSPGRDEERRTAATTRRESVVTTPSLNMSLPSISEVTESTSRFIRVPQTSLDREVAELRTRASLADTERRRFREEKKWAESQGNRARAEQMKWQVKRYTALMDSFNREADAKIVEGSKGRPSNGLDPTKANGSTTGPIIIIPPR